MRADGVVRAIAHDQRVTGRVLGCRAEPTARQLMAELCKQRVAQVRPHQPTGDLLLPEFAPCPVQACEILLGHQHDLALRIALLGDASGFGERLPARLLWPEIEERLVELLRKYTVDHAMRKRVFADRRGGDAPKNVALNV